MKDIGPMARLAEVKGDVAAPGVIFDLLTDASDPQTLPGIAKQWGLPRGAFVSWFTTQHRDKYDAALKVLTDTMVFDAIRIADDAEPEEVAKAKLRIETRLKTAARWDRERYGERESPALVVNLSLADTAKEIRELEERLGVLARPALPAALPMVDVVDAEPI